MKWLYSPNQVLATGLLGGPLAVLFALKCNYDALGLVAGSQAVVRWGVAVVIVLLSVLPFLPGSFPQLVIPLAYSFAGRALAESTQRSREQIAQDEQLDFMPTGRLVTHSLAAMLVFMLAAMLWLGTLDTYGIIELPEPPK